MLSSTIFLFLSYSWKYFVFLNINNIKYLEISLEKTPNKYIIIVDKTSSLYWVNSKKEKISILIFGNFKEWYSIFLSIISLFSSINLKEVSETRLKYLPISFKVLYIIKIFFLSSFNNFSLLNFNLCALYILYNTLLYSSKKLIISVHFGFFVFLYFILNFLSNNTSLKERDVSLLLLFILL